MESTSGMVKPWVDPDPVFRSSTPGKLLLRLVRTKAIVDAREVLLQADIREAPLEADGGEGEDEGEVVDTREVLLQAGVLATSLQIGDIREAPLEADVLRANLLQIVAVGRYLPRLCETLGQSPLKE